jgi:hypothetical protein
MASGGSRPGAGRPKKDREQDGQLFETAEQYLTAVVQGTIAPDPARIAAARTLICYQQSKTRRPKPTLPAKELERKEHLADMGDFEDRAAAIRAKFEASEANK